MRVLHIGNIANNAYNITKGLRERGFEADCYTDYYRHYISTPEWEDADLDEAPACDDYTPVDWNQYNLKGFQRPEWYMETPEEAFANSIKKSRPVTLLRMLSFIQNESLPENHLNDLCHELASGASGRRMIDQRTVEKIIFGHLPLEGEKFPDAKSWLRFLASEFARICSAWHSPLTFNDCTVARFSTMQYFLSRYDAIQTYGAFQLFYPMLYAPSVPQITFEHGTMREFPFQNSPTGRKAMLAYKRAFANIITNADAIHNARRMELNNYVFIPHPVDDAKFRPMVDPAFRKSLLEKYDANFLFLASARQNWELKGNDKMIRAFARLIRKTGKGPKLLLGGWGQEISRSAALIAELGLDTHVVWLPPLPKKMLARHINAADAVLDQFMLGAFGTTTPEAMACAKPVLLHYNRADHAWCLEEDPPVINVCETDEIFEAMLKIYENPAYAENVGRNCLDWFRRFHSMDVVIGRHLELYKRLEHAPQTVRVGIPVMEKELMRDLKIVCFINISGASGKDAERWLQGVDNKSALRILNSRLKNMHPRCEFVLAMNEDQNMLKAEAEGLGWRIVTDHLEIGDFMLAPDFFDHSKFNDIDFFYVCSLDEPFMDAAQIGAWKFSEFQPSEIISGENKNNPYIPIRIYSRAFIEYRQKLRDLFSEHFTPLQVQSIMIRYGLSLPAPAPAVSDVKLVLVNKEYYAPDLDAEKLKASDLENTDQIELLKKAMKDASDTQAINAELNALETARKYDVLESFPVYVGINLTSVCSAHCAFCSIQPKEQKFKDAVTLADIRQMDWLRHVQTLSVWGGIGDSLVNREFVPIVNYLHDTFPNLKLDLSTNGILLNEEVCQTIAKCLTSFNVSLNAATRVTWEKLMRSRGFDNVCRGIKRIAELRKSERVPSIAVSFVMTRDNIHEAVNFVNLAYELGADKVTFVHYVPTTLVGRRDLAPDQSLYLDRELSDKMLLAAEQRAHELGLGFTGPTLFNKKAEYIHFGSRAMTHPPACDQPWRTCYLTVDEDGKRQMIFCCSSFYYQIGYDKSSLDEKNFKKIWNHPAARYFRSTVHKRGINPICSYCTGIDCFDPKNRQNLTINEVIQPWFEKLDIENRKGCKMDISRMAAGLQKALEKGNSD